MQGTCREPLSVEGRLTCSLAGGICRFLRADETGTTDAVMKAFDRIHEGKAFDPWWFSLNPSGSYGPINEQGGEHAA
jgi:hypothetical protein